MELENMLPLHLKRFYSKLQDQESQDIFINFLNYYLSGRDLYYMNRRYSYGNDSPEEEQQSIDRFFYNYLNVEYEDPLFIVGGLHGLAPIAISNFKDHGIVAEAFCDITNTYHKNIFCGIRTIDMQQLINGYPNGIAIVLETDEQVISVFEQYAISKGWDRKQIKKLRKNVKTYFGLPEIRPRSYEVYIDGGSFNGDSILDFIDWTQGQYDEIFAIEPDIHNYVALQNTIEKHHINKIHPVRAGLWDSEDILSFRCQNDSSCFDRKAFSKVRTVTIDSLVGYKKVTFLKLDVEGAEYKALIGARNTIVKHRPRLAICVYHKPVDILRLSLYVHNLVPEYKFYLRQHDEGYNNTVLYATAD